MADKKIPIFHSHGSDKTEFAHLRPLSVYSRMITCESTDTSSSNPSWIPNSPFCNIKVEIINSHASVNLKRRLDDSCLDETYETPLKKKPCLASCHSPDLACVLDSTLPDPKNITPSLSLVAEKANNADNSSSNEETDPQVTSLKSSSLVWPESCDESDGQSSPSLSLSDDRTSSPLILVSGDTGDLGPAFDFDIDEIMCLSPIDRDDEQPSCDGLDDFVQSCQSFYEEQRSCKHSEACEGHSSSTKCQTSEQVQGGNDIGVESDEGYFTKSYKTAKLKGSKDVTPPESQTVTLVMSTPLDKFRQLVKRSPLLKKLQKTVQGSPVVNQEPLSASSPITLYGSVSLDASNTESFPETLFLDRNENKEGEVGTSIQKSLGCHGVQQAPIVTVIDSHAEKMKDVPSARQKVDPKFQVTFEEETDSSTSVESPSPLQVQVKSKVVLPSIQRPEVKTKSAVKVAAEAAATTQQPEEKPQSGDTKKVSKDIQRPVVYYKEEDWEREKTVYVDSVIRHMKDNTGAGDGVMTELLNLMNTVANQGNGSYGRPWQHPSDLTHRNYKPRHSGHLFSLDEWQNLNFRFHRRFAKVPQPFIRSPVL
ncbi:hypothetical protein MHYP_G00045870 [Metynnis hypsauchen]